MDHDIAKNMTRLQILLKVDRLGRRVESENKAANAGQEEKKPQKVRLTAENMGALLPQEKGRKRHLPTNDEISKALHK